MALVETYPIGKYDLTNVKKAKISKNKMRVETLPSFKILKDEKDYLEVEVNDTSYRMINELRRIILNEIEWISIDTVEITQNTSIFYDEILSHRIAMIPLICDDITKLIKQGECQCEDTCLRCSCEFTINVRGRNVMSDDIEVNVPYIRPLKGIEIAKLKKWEEINVKGLILKNTSSYSALYSPVTLATYQPKPIISINLNSTEKRKQEISEICPNGVFKDDSVDIEDLSRCNFCGICNSTYPESIEVNFNPTQFWFFLETKGNVKASQLLVTAIKILHEKLQEI